MAPLALPNYTFKVTPPGGTAIDYTLNLTYAGSQNQMSITQNFGRQGDTATFILTDDWQGRTSPNFVIPVESQVTLFDNTANQSLFAGVVTMPTLVVRSANLNEWVLQCTDYTYYADSAYVAGTFNGYTIDKIIVALTNQANCGITAATVANGGFVHPAPSLARYAIDYTKLSSVWRSLSQLASISTPYGWYVDQNRALHFFDPTTAINSGITFTTSPTIAGSLTEGHIARSGFRYDFDGTLIANRILVKGSNQTILTNRKGSPTGSWRADGTQDSWGLKFTVTGTPTLKLNGVATSVTVVKAGSSSTAKWQVTQNANGQWYLTARTAPSSGTVIHIWYDYQIPVLGKADDIPSQQTYTGPNHGIFTKLVNDSSILTVDMAIARAQRERTEYAFAAERTTFESTEEFFGYLRAGYTFTYDNALVNDTRRGNAWGINGSFLCTANTVGFRKGGYRKMTITGVRI